MTLIKNRFFTQPEDIANYLVVTYLSEGDCNEIEGKRDTAGIIVVRVPAAFEALVHVFLEDSEWCPFLQMDRKKMFLLEI